MVSRTLFAVSDDETRYFMNGIFVEKRDDSLVMVATDGRRLSWIARKVPVPMDSLKGVILPPKILTIVRKLASGEGNLSLALTDKSVFVRLGERSLSSSLIEGQFPDYRRVIPDSQKHHALVDRVAFEDALQARVAARRAEVAEDRLPRRRRPPHHLVEGKRAGPGERRGRLRVQRAPT